jgi:thermitase
MPVLDFLKVIASISSAAIMSTLPVMTVEAAAPESGADAQMSLVEYGSERWDLRQIQAAEAWAAAGEEQGVIVAVLDSGIDDSHAALKGSVVERVDLSGDANADIEGGHGTHIAGIIAARRDDKGEGGLAGAARLLDVRVAASDGRTNAEKVRQGILWAVEHGARVINISIVIDGPYPPLAEVVDFAWEKGCVIVAAAGNNGFDEVAYPAYYPNVIAVAATDREDVLTSWSAGGDWVEVAAPGVDIYSTLPAGRFGTRSGTSFSSALVAGEAALLYPLVKDRDRDGRVNDEVVDLIVTNSAPVNGWLSQGGRINIGQAVQAAVALE